MRHVKVREQMKDNIQFISLGSDKRMNMETWVLIWTKANGAEMVASELQM